MANYIQYLLIFTVSACLMGLEIVTGRIMAYHYGGTIYAWTATIGVTLAGLSVGNYIGGQFAEKLSDKKQQARLCVVVSVVIFVSILIRNLLNDSDSVHRILWPYNIVIHALLLMFGPCLVLGCIPPVAASIVLRNSSHHGDILGKTYAAATAGGLAGTFLTGYYLIDLIGTSLVIWMISLVFLVLGIAFGRRRIGVLLWGIILAGAGFAAFLPVEEIKVFSQRVHLTEKRDPFVLYEDESQYSRITIKKDLPHIDRRSFMLDKLVHSTIMMDRPFQLETPYILIYAGLTEKLMTDDLPKNILMIGGGGYVFPGYVKRKWPGCQIDVVEIDPAVTKAAMSAFGLREEMGLNIIHKEGRQFIAELTEKKSKGDTVKTYDLIFLDAVDDFSVPYQLVTRQFHENVAGLLTPGGIFVYVTIDIYDYGNFLAANYMTLKQTFRHVHILSQVIPEKMRNTFVFIASNESVPIESVLSHNFRIKVKTLSGQEIEALLNRTRPPVLTDDFVPVETLLMPVFRDYFEESE